jgi:hypothetical protein
MIKLISQHQDRGSHLRLLAHLHRQRKRKENPKLAHLGQNGLLDHQQSLEISMGKNLTL